MNRKTERKLKAALADKILELHPGPSERLLLFCKLRASRLDGRKMAVAVPSDQQHISGPFAAVDQGVITAIVFKLIAQMDKGRTVPEG